MLKPIHISEALRIFKRSLKVKLFGLKRYKGTPNQICRAIIKDCYNKKHNYFQTSKGHFSEFYTRDFAFCCKPLINLGYKKQVKNTLIYALKHFSKSHISSTISPCSTPFDFPVYAVDSLPLFIKSLNHFPDLIEKHKDFLNKEILYFKNKVLDSSGLVKKGHFSSIKDQSIRSSSCYDNCMLALLASELNHPLLNPFKETDYKKLIKDNFWNNKYFFDDKNKKSYIAGDANIFPFYTIFSNKQMFNKTVLSIKKANLDKPFPLKYTESSKPKNKMLSTEFLTKNYEVNSVWMHMGLIHLQLLKKFKHKDFKKHLNTYTNLIKKHKNFLEVYNNNGKPFSSPFYYSDDSMLWCSIYQELTS